MSKSMGNPETAAKGSSPCHTIYLSFDGKVQYNISSKRFVSVVHGPVANYTD